MPKGEAIGMDDLLNIELRNDNLRMFHQAWKYTFMDIERVMAFLEGLYSDVYWNNRPLSGMLWSCAIQGLKRDRKKRQGEHKTKTKGSLVRL